MTRMFPDSFDWSAWRSGSLHELGVTYKQAEMIRCRGVIRKYSIGYCYGWELICRPKIDCIGVMFLYNDKFFWTHLSITEFNNIFPEIELC